jgi:hypothetical protein
MIGVIVPTHQPPLLLHAGCSAAARAGRAGIPHAAVFAGRRGGRRSRIRRHAAAPHDGRHHHGRAHFARPRITGR